MKKIFLLIQIQSTARNNIILLFYCQNSFLRTPTIMAAAAEKRKKIRRVSEAIRAHALKSLTCEVATSASQKLKKFPTLPNYKSGRRVLSRIKYTHPNWSQEIENNLYTQYMDRETDYIYHLMNILAAVKTYGNGVEISQCWDWEDCIIKESQKNGAMDGDHQHEKKPDDSGDPTRKPLEEIYYELELDGKAQLIQCRKCKSWNVRFTTLQLRSLDEPGTTKAQCQNCFHNWTEHS